MNELFIIFAEFNFLEFCAHSLHAASVMTARIRICAIGAEYQLFYYTGRVRERIQKLKAVT